ncbi:SAF domain-containing protein, partial [Rhizobium ruizarguesonis]
NVLVSSANLPVGARLYDKLVHWMAWPQGGVVQGLITEADNPDAIKDLQGAVVRLPIFEGEPIRPEKIADSISRILSSLLPPISRSRRRDCRPATA